MTRRCPNCGAVLAERDVFCGDCGARVPVAAPTTIAQPPMPPAPPPAAEPASGKGKFVLAGGAAVAVAVAGVAAVVVCLCLVVIVASGVLNPPAPTPTLVARATRTLPPRQPTATPIRPTSTLPSLPTATRRPSPGPTRPATAVSTAYTDDFGKDSGNWNLAASSSGKRWIADGELHIEVTVANYVVWAGLQNREYVDVAAEVNARVASGTGGNYGLLFRIKDDDNFYRFVISTGGSYRIVKLVGKQWKTIQDWARSSAIRTDGATNRLKVVARGPSITVYANGQKLATVTDADHPVGGVALVVAAGSETGFHVAFDDFQVRPASLLD